MVNIYNYLKIVYQNLKQENSKNTSFVAVVFVLLCIPLTYSLNSISLGLLFIMTLFSFKKSNFKLNKTLLLPIILYLLMAISLIWTRDFSGSFKALSKELPLLILPLCFFIFPSFSKEQKQKAIQYYSYGIAVFTLFCLTKAIVRYVLSSNVNVFFYHELVTEDVNAIHVSVYVCLAIFYFIIYSSKTILDKIIIILLTLFLILLSSKNISIVFFGLVIFYYLRYNKTTVKEKTVKLSLLFIIVIAIAFTGKIKDRFLIEYQSNAKENSINKEISTQTGIVYNVSAKLAWTQDNFNPNDFFAGTAFRVYQIRIFKEMLQEDPIFFTGYGLNATDFKIAEKRIEHNLYKGYENKNFHNEYIQIFAEIGFFGLILLITMVLLNFKNAIKKQDFMHISFAVLMISLFLTESFLSRQRGIVFFTIFYCLFNADNLIVTSRKE